MTMTLEQVRGWHLEGVRRLNSYRHHFPNDSTVLAALIMHHQSMADAIDAHLTQPAQPVDIEAIREVIESHINEAKKLRHDPESQDYLYEQADKLEAALPELKP